MKLPNWLEKTLLTLSNWWYRNLPQSEPTLAQLQQCRLISHRGEHDNETIFENTLLAFHRAKIHGVWGIELDIQWTKDFVPVAFHDPDCIRLHQKPLIIHETIFSDLRKQLPLIPSLNEVIQQFGGEIHLMLELKQESFTNPSYQAAILQEVLATLTPVKDYHFISLNPTLFSMIHYPPSQTFLPISYYINAAKTLGLTQQKQYGGVIGHFLMIRSSLRRKCQEQGLIVGTGMIDSINCLYRELRQGSDYIFSDQAAALQKHLNTLTYLKS